MCRGLTLLFLSLFVCPALSEALLLCSSAFLWDLRLLAHFSTEAFYPFFLFPEVTSKACGWLGGTPGTGEKALCHPWGCEERPSVLLLSVICPRTPSGRVQCVTNLSPASPSLSVHV